MSHVSAVIDRLDIPEGVEIEFGLELSFDGGLTWDKNFTDTSVDPAVCYSHRLGAKVTGSKLPGLDGTTLSSRGTDVPNEVRVRAFCSHDVAVRIVYS